MLYASSIKAAADDVVAAALLGVGWQAALTRFAQAGGARDAILMRNTAHQFITGVTTEEFVGAMADFAAGRSPPSSRYERVKLSPRAGFRLDHDDYTDAELARDPFYQEFLRPRGLFWHANIVLSAGGGEYVEIGLKRRIELGPYHRNDATVLNSVLPELRASARIAKSRLDAEARGMEWLLKSRGEVIIEIDSRGRVLPGQAAGEANPLNPLRIRGQRLASTDPTVQRTLDRAVAVAVARPGRMAVVPLVGLDGRRHLLQILPVPGLARDVFLSAAAIAVLIERDPEPPVIRLDAAAIREAFNLTDREADVASLLAEGLDVPAIASLLRIRPETARAYLKAVFEKTGSHRQAELVALLARLIS